MRAPHEEIVITRRVPAYSVRRYYDPATGQFGTVDPLIDRFGKSYAYADGDPPNTIDPLGLCNANPFSLSFWSQGNCLSAHSTQAVEYAAAGGCVVVTDGACLVLASFALGYSTGVNAVNAFGSGLTWCNAGTFARSESLTLFENLVLGGGALIKGGLGAAGLFGDAAPTSLAGNAALNAPFSAAAAAVTALGPTFEQQASGQAACGCG